MDTIINFAQTVSPLGIIALLVLVIYQMVKNSGALSKTTGTEDTISKKNLSDFIAINKKLDLLSENHLSGLPEMSDTLKRLDTKSDKIIELLTRIDARLK